MRRYRPSAVICDGCGKPITVSREEFRMVDGRIYHVLCAPAVSR